MASVAAAASSSGRATVVTQDATSEPSVSLSLRAAARTVAPAIQSRKEEPEANAAAALSALQAPYGHQPQPPPLLTPSRSSMSRSRPMRRLSWRRRRLRGQRYLQRRADSALEPNRGLPSTTWRASGKSQNCPVERSSMCSKGQSHLRHPSAESRIRFQPTPTLYVMVVGRLLANGCWEVVLPKGEIPVDRAGNVLAFLLQNPPPSLEVKGVLQPAIWEPKGGDGFGTKQYLLPRSGRGLIHEADFTRQRNADTAGASVFVVAGAEADSPNQSLNRASTDLPDRGS